MANRLSFSKINSYSQCSYRYKLNYVDGWREKNVSSALFFGTAIDESLNSLLMDRDLEKAKAIFHKQWSFQFVNGNMTSLSDCPNILYGNSDFDEELLTDEDCEKINLTDYARLVTLKAEKSFNDFSLEERRHYNFCNWLSMRRKGLIMLESYAEKILPKIKRTLCVQNKFELSNGDDVVVGVADCILEWDDGRIMLMDNKTAAKEYTPDQAARSQQLILYYHRLRDEYKLDGVGFIVMLKNIRKNKTKICSKCAHDGSGSRSKTCDLEAPGVVVKRGKEVPGMIRCDGAWLEHIKPEAFIQTLFSEVAPAAEDLVLSSFDDANTGIKNNYFPKNLSACTSPWPCAYYKVCWTGSYEDVVKRIV